MLAEDIWTDEGSLQFDDVDLTKETPRGRLECLEILASQDRIQNFAVAFDYIRKHDWGPPPQRMPTGYTAEDREYIMICVLGYLMDYSRWEASDQVLAVLETLPPKSRRIDMSPAFPTTDYYDGDINPGLMRRIVRLHNQPDTRELFHALEASAAQGSLEMVRMFDEKGANLQTPTGRSAIVAAITDPENSPPLQQTQTILRYALDRQSNDGTRNVLATNALIAAGRQQHTALAAYLLSLELGVTPHMETIQNAISESPSDFGDAFLELLAKAVPAKSNHAQHNRQGRARNTAPRIT